MFLLRPAKASDRGEILELARYLDSPNLPADDDFLRQRLARSEAAFDEMGPPGAGREYQLVLLDETDRVVGTSAILSKHGTPGLPHVALRVGVEIRRSASTGIEMRHTTLQLQATEDGPTEIGALVLQPDLRGHPGAPGKLLSWGRFACIARHPHAFESSVLAEMRASLDPAGRYAFWDAFGRRFTSMSYEDADRRSSGDKSFILDLFPDTPFYAALLADDVVADLGKVHLEARPALTLLERAGFHWIGQIDPFDAGPYYGASMADVVPVRDTSFGTIAPRGPGPNTPLQIVTAGTGSAFRAVAAPASVHRDGVRTDKEARRRLGLEDGDEASVAPLPISAPKETYTDE